MSGACSYRSAVINLCIFGVVLCSWCENVCVCMCVCMCVCVCYILECVLLWRQIIFKVTVLLEVLCDGTLDFYLLHLRKRSEFLSYKKSPVTVSIRSSLMRAQLAIMGIRNLNRK